MSIFLRYLFSFIYFVLIGCVHQEQIAKHIEQVECKKECIKQFQLCHNTCKNNCGFCTHFHNNAALHRYDRYKNEQCVQGKMITRQLQSYRDPLKCTKVTCNCHDDYTVCSQSCQSVIQKSVKIVPICC